MVRPPRKIPPDRVSAGEAVFEKLLGDILDGTYLRGARLPAERDLVEHLGASRASVRDALRRLADRGVIAVRPGSGAVVRPQREWSFDVLPECLRHGGSLAAEPATRTGLIGDALALRRGIVVTMVQLAAGRIARGGLAPARAAVERAWQSRHEAAAFAEADFEIMRLVLEAAGMLPAVWLLNNLAGVYRGAITAMNGAPLVPPAYVQSHTRVFDALEKGQGRRAAELMERYLDEADRGRLRALSRRKND